MTRVPVVKTNKLFIDGRFVRSESGRTMPVKRTGGGVVALACRGSRKDLRDAVDAARSALGGWSRLTAYHRGQILYRIAEMLETRIEELAESVAASGVTPAAARREATAAVDRLVCFAGWTDKLAHVLGCQNDVAGPYRTFTAPEPAGVVGVMTPERPPLLGLVSMIAPPLCAGNTVVAVAGSRAATAAGLLAEACATSDVPAGALNLLTGDADELIDAVATHRDLDAVGAANLTAARAATLRRGVSGNFKRVHLVRHTAAQWYERSRCDSPWTIHPFVEMKTVWQSARVSV